MPSSHGLHEPVKGLYQVERREGVAPTYPLALHRAGITADLTLHRSVTSLHRKNLVLVRDVYLARFVQTATEGRQAYGLHRRGFERLYKCDEYDLLDWTNEAVAKFA
jgi:hypothetical protein